MRQAQTRTNPAAAAHAGLVLARYLAHPADGSPAARDARDAAHRTAADAARLAASNPDPSDLGRRGVYKAAFDRWGGGLPAGHRSGLFKTAPRLIVGIGGHNVLETGLTLHHTYGVPVIPGTALKGLAAHYCHRVWGAGDPGFLGDKKPGEFHKVLFGSTDEGGLVAFHDAWPDPATVRLVPDVMTPHHSKYYMQEQDAPSDSDDPVPVSFLAVEGTFRVAVSASPSATDGWTAAAQQQWVGRAFELLAEALKNWGIGAKTAAGYGRLTPAG